MAKIWTAEEFRAIFPTIEGNYLGSDLQYHRCIFKADNQQGEITGVSSQNPDVPSYMGRLLQQYRAYEIDGNTPIRAYYNSNALYEPKFILDFNFYFLNCTSLTIGFYSYNYPQNERDVYANTNCQLYQTNNAWIYDNTYIPTMPNSDGVHPQMVNDRTSYFTNSLTCSQIEINNSSQIVHMRELSISIVCSSDSYGSVVGVILPITNDEATIYVGGDIIYPFNGGDSVAQGGGGGTFSAPSNDRGDTSGTEVQNIAVNVNNIVNSVLVSGGIKIYAPNNNQLNATLPLLYTSNFLSRFLQSMYNPLSGVISYMLLPTNLVSTSGGARHLTVSGYDLSAESTLPDDDKNISLVNLVKWYHVGTVSLGRYFDAFPDFEPYTQIDLYLPYIGTVTIPTNLVMYGSITVDYLCESMSGNVTAWIACRDKDNRGSYLYATGNAAFSIPVFANTQGGEAVGKIIASASSLAVGDLGGSFANATSAYLSTTAHKMDKSGSFSGNVGLLSDSVCYLKITRPQWVETPNYKPLHGLPSYIGNTIAEMSLTGFVQVDAIELNAIPCTDEEKALILQYMQNGVHINGEGGE